MHLISVAVVAKCLLLLVPMCARNTLLLAPCLLYLCLPFVDLLTLWTCAVLLLTHQAVGATIADWRHQNDSSDEAVWRRRRRWRILASDRPFVQTQEQPPGSEHVETSMPMNRST